MDVLLLSYYGAFFRNSSIVGTKEVTLVLKDGETIIIVDGLSGDVFLNHLKEVIAEYRAKRSICRSTSWMGKLKDTTKTYTKAVYQSWIGCKHWYIGFRRCCKWIAGKECWFILYRILIHGFSEMPTRRESIWSLQGCFGSMSRKTCCRSCFVDLSTVGIRVAYLPLPWNRHSLGIYHLIQISLNELTNISRTQLRVSHHVLLYIVSTCHV